MNDIGRLRLDLERLARRVATLEAARPALAIGVFTDENRPPARSLPPGTPILNLTALRPEWCDGTVWRDADGNDLGG